LEKDNTTITASYHWLNHISAPSHTHTHTTVYSSREEREQLSGCLLITAAYGSPDPFTHGVPATISSHRSCAHAHSEANSEASTGGLKPQEKSVKRFYSCSAGQWHYKTQADQKQEWYVQMFKIRSAISAPGVATLFAQSTLHIRLYAFILYNE
jgi:hypothetical protein